MSVAAVALRRVLSRHDTEANPNTTASAVVNDKKSAAGNAEVQVQKVTSSDADSPAAEKGPSTAAAQACGAGDGGDGGGARARRGVVGGVAGLAGDSWDVVKKFAKFVGPGWMVSVAYVDPGNYATDVAAGSSYKYQLLVMILVSNCIAIFLQTLCVKLGSVTGLNLAEMTRKHCPPWLNFVLFLFAEAAIVSTDIAEVIGTAIALNLLLHIPLVAGCAISICDVLFILIFYRPGNSMTPGGSMRGLRIFEMGVAALVLGVAICFAIELSFVDIPNVGELFRGFLPSSALIQTEGLLQACGILGATVMPHSLYLGSSIVQPRLYQYDQKHDHVHEHEHDNDNDDDDANAEGEGEGERPKYRPSLAAIRYCLKYSVADLSISLFTFGLFINSAILIVAGASLYGQPGAEDTASTLFGVFALLQSTIGKAAGIIFALALLLSGVSAGIICTIAGQIVWLGQVKTPMKPWVQRLMTRSIAIVPSIIVAGAVGEAGVSAALVGSQIALSAILPFVSAPLIWFTCQSKYMTIPAAGPGQQPTNMRNGWVTATVAVLLWLLIVVMNVASWVLQATGS